MTPELKTIFDLVKPPFKMSHNSVLISDCDNEPLAFVHSNEIVHQINGAEMLEQFRCWIAEAMNEKWEREVKG